METNSTHSEVSVSATTVQADQGAAGRDGRGWPGPSARLMVLSLIPLAYLWFRLINNLRLEWMTNPQYGYGAIVPFLCFGLILRRVPTLADKETSRIGESAWHSRFNFLVWAACFFAVLYFPTRLVEEATPEWRPIQWSLGVSAIGLTLCWLYVFRGWTWMRRLAAPILFFFVAIPWPTYFEIPIIQTLTQANATCVVEVMSFMGVPAVQHGNLIEIGKGVVGIDEACSGIRSFQSSLMISLFLGEYFRLRHWARLTLVPIGFALSFLFNVGRTSLLTLVAARQGVGAIADYHDPAGVSILIACTACMGLAAWLMKRRQIRLEPACGESGEAAAPGEMPAKFPPLRFAVALGVWLLLVEAGVFLWYRSLEAKVVAGPDWAVSFPSQNPTYKSRPVPEKTRYLLRYDEGMEGEWRERDGTQWQAWYFNWHPGRVAGYLAKRHTPEICLTAAGQNLVFGPELMQLNVRGVDLAVRRYVFESARGGAMHVFHARWEAGAPKEAAVQYDSSRFNLVRAIWSGRGNHGQKVFEVIIQGVADPEQAKKVFVERLREMIAVGGVSAGKS